jgi:hypothetical protein
VDAYLKSESPNDLDELSDEMERLASETTELREIDWKRLPARVQELVPWIETCLESRDVPISRKRYVVNKLHLPVRRRKLRPKDLKMLVFNGYYGSRGVGIM